MKRPGLEDVIDLTLGVMLLAMAVIAVMGCVFGVVEIWRAL